MPKSFSEQQKKNIRHKLLTECTQQWSKYGYKKTSIDTLCANAGISKGAFYSFFNSKEALFCEALCLVQDNLYKQANEIMANSPNKYGLAEVLKVTYRQYCKHSFICNTTSVDFISFTNKLSPIQLTAIAEYSQKAGQVFLNKPYIKFKINQKKAISVITALLAMVSSKEKMCYDHLEVFDFMVDNLINDICE